MAGGGEGLEEAMESSSSSSSLWGVRTREEAIDEAEEAEGRLAIATWRREVLVLLLDSSSVSSPSNATDVSTSRGFGSAAAAVAAQPHIGAGTSVLRFFLRREVLGPPGLVTPLWAAPVTFFSFSFSFNVCAVLPLPFPFILPFCFSSSSSVSSDNSESESPRAGPAAGEAAFAFFFRLPMIDKMLA